MQNQSLTPQNMLQQTSEVVCVECEGSIFESAFMFRKQSKLLTGSTEDLIVPIQIFTCKQCGSPIEELMPPMS
jgi:hypothetical protein